MLTRFQLRAGSKAHILRTALHNLKTFLPAKERRLKTNFTSQGRTRSMPECCVSELHRRVIYGQSDHGRQPRKVGFTGRVRFQEVEMQGWAGTKG